MTGLFSKMGYECEAHGRHPIPSYPARALHVVCHAHRSSNHNGKPGPGEVKAIISCLVETQDLVLPRLPICQVPLSLCIVHFACDVDRMKALTPSVPVFFLV